MAITKRVQWRCPYCGRKYKVPAHEVTRRCPKCEKRRSATDPAAKTGNAASSRSGSPLLAVWSGAITAGVIAIVLIFVFVRRSQEEPALSLVSESKSSSAPKKTVPPKSPAAEQQTPVVRQVQEPKTMTPAQVYRSASGSVVEIVAMHDGQPFSAGSGFVLSPGEMIVTNHHVVTGASELKIKMGKAEWTAKRAYVVASRDLAFIPIPETVKAGKGLTLAPELPSIGDAVYAIGSPHGLSQTFTNGIVSQVRGFLLQHNAGIGPGSSGGPLLNSAGQVVGVNVSMANPDAGFQNMNFAIGRSEVARLSELPLYRDLNQLGGYLDLKQEIARQAEMRKAAGKSAPDAGKTVAELNREYRERAKKSLAMFRANWSRLRKGLTTDEVIDLLGKPLNVSDFRQLKGIETLTMQYCLLTDGADSQFVKLTFNAQSHLVKWDTPKWEQVIGPLILQDEPKLP